MKIVALCVRPEAYELIHTWVNDQNHELALVVTSRGPIHDRAEDYTAIVNAAPPTQDIFITTDMTRLADVVRPLNVDLLVSCTFPFRIPEDVRLLPRLGSFNLHAMPLPHYRGPNPTRMIFDGYPSVGAAFHKMTDDYDAGPILSRCESPLPEVLTPISVWETWRATIVTAFYEGMARAMAADPGQPQPPAGQLRATGFSEVDRLLDWTMSGRSVLLRWIGLELFGPGAIASYQGGAHRVLQVEFRPATSELPPPGTVVAQSSNGVEVSVKDGIVSIALDGLSN
jgi:methionyl-tRNA formyltransferase